MRSKDQMTKVSWAAMCRSPAREGLNARAGENLVAGVSQAAAGPVLNQAQARASPRAMTYNHSPAYVRVPFFAFSRFALWIFAAGLPLISRAVVQGSRPSKNTCQTGIHVLPIYVLSPRWDDATTQLSPPNHKRTPPAAYLAQFASNIAKGSVPPLQLARQSICNQLQTRGNPPIRQPTLDPR